MTNGYVGLFGCIYSFFSRYIKSTSLIIIADNMPDSQVPNTRRTPQESKHPIKITVRMDSQRRYTCVREDRKTTIRPPTATRTYFFEDLFEFIEK